MEMYTARLQALSDSSNSALLLAHAYVRYMGDLSGGQVIKPRLAKAYGVDVTDLDSPEGNQGPNNGVSLYEFTNLEGTKKANVGDIKKIKGWYRIGMNEGAGDDEKLKGGSDSLDSFSF